MSESKKSKRPYNSARRQAQARETRLKIIEAARGLFTEYGYAGATIEAIAQQAGVAPETIYAVFGSKRAILERLIDISVGGNDAPIPLLERPGPQAVLRERDPRRQLRLFAADISGILARVAPLFEVMRAAAKTEPEIDELLQSILQQRLHTIESSVGHMALREGLTEAGAAETVWALSSPEIYCLLTVDRGWTRDAYIDWLGDSLIRLLL
jgi:AcrR family transcriptional regulator